MTTRKWFGLMTLAVVPLCLAADGLNLTPGLWELTYTMGVTGMVIPPAAMAQMTPEQKARMAAAMKNREAAGPKTHVVKSCITAKELAEGTFAAQDDKEDKSCKNKIVTQSATKQEMTVSCTGDGARTGRIQVEALDTRHMKGLVDMALSNGGKSNMQLTGKWLATSCAGADDE